MIKGVLYKKRGDSSGIVMKTIVFVVPTLIILVGFFLFVNRASSQATLTEQIYSKQIALVIDKSRPGTEVSMDISKLYEIATKNNVKGSIINISNSEKSVWIHLVTGIGYKYYFFSNNRVVWNRNDSDMKLYLRIEK